MKTNGSKTKLLAVVMASSLIAAGLSACGNNNDSAAPAPGSPSATASVPASSSPAPSAHSEDAAILKAFKAKIAQKAALAELNAQLDSDLPKVSNETADEMLRELLSYYDAQLPDVQKQFESDTLQQQLQKLQWPLPIGDLTGITDAIEDEAARKQVQEILNGGFKLETAEGFVFPVVDYGKLNKYDSYVSPAMKDYIALLAVESNQKTASDGGLVISWEELANRTLAAEQYVKDYPDSPEKEGATQRCVQYLTDLLYGLDNTPIFDFDTFKVKPEITELYKKIISEHPDTATAKLAGQFLDVLDKTDGYVFRKGSDGGQTNIPEVQAFREQLESQAKSLLG